MDMLDRRSSGRPVRACGPAACRRIAVLCAVAALAQPFAIAAQQSTPHAQIEIQLAAGEAAVSAGNAKEALVQFAAALPQAEAVTADALIGRALAGLGWAQWANGQYDAALVSRRRALEIFTRLDDPVRRAAVLRGIGETFYSLGRYADALDHYRLALENVRRYSDPLQEGLILSNIGSTYRSQGDLDAAAGVLEESISILRPTGNRGALGQVLTFLGIVHRARGEYDRALASYREAIAARRDAGDKRGEAQALGNMANVHLDLGEYERSAALNRQSLALAEEVGYTVQVGFAHQNLGAALSNIPRPQEALHHYERALAIYRQIGRATQVRWTLLNIGTLQAFLLDQPAAGRATLTEGLTLARAGGDREATGYLLYELGSLDLREGRAPAAMTRLDEALEIARALRLPDLEYKVLGNRGLAAARLERPNDAIDDLRASAAIINDLRANVTSDQAKIAYVDTRQSVFHDLALVLARHGRAEEALEAAEAGRARALADLLGQRQVLGRPADRQVLQQVRTSLAVASRTPDGGAGTRGATDAVRASIEALGTRNPELASLLTVGSPDVAEIRSTARRLGATIVEYLTAGDTLLAWVVRPDGSIEHARQPVAAGGIASRVRRLRSVLDAPTLDDLRHPQRLDADLRALHASLIDPVLQWLPASDPAAPVIIVPQGETAFVPFAALVDAHGVPLIERHALVLAPAISTYRYTGAKRSDAPWDNVRALVVADPRPPAGSALPRLPGTLVEGRNVARRLGRGARLLTGADATEAAVKAEVTDRRVIHFATHGLVSPARPIASSVLFAEGAEDDGYLRLDEVFGLELRADLVVLSGCSTGLGRLTGDGIFGLARGFMYAGTPSVVVSFWDVSDRATAWLMDHFYASLATGRSKASALAAAQRATRARFPHPALWAGFVLVGEPR